MVDVLTFTSKSLRQPCFSVSLPQLPQLGSTVSSAASKTCPTGFPVIGSALDTTRQRCEDLVQVSTSAMTLCGALQCGSFKLDEVFVQAALILSGLFAPDVGTVLSPQLQQSLEALCTYLAALQAEVASMMTRVQKFAAAHCEFSAEVQKFVSSLSPSASLVTLESRVHDVSSVLEQEDQKVALQELAEGHMHAVLKTAKASTQAPGTLPPVLWRSFMKEQRGGSSSSTNSGLGSLVSASSPSLPRLDTTAKGLAAQTLSKLPGAASLHRSSVMKASGGKVGRGGGGLSLAAAAAAAAAAATSGGGSSPSKKQALTGVSMRNETIGSEPVAALRSQLAAISAELMSVKAELETSKAELSVVGMRHRDKSVPMFARTLRSTGVFPALSDAGESSRRGSGEGSGLDLVATKIELSQTSSTTGEMSSDAVKLRRLRHDFDQESKELAQVRKQLSDSLSELDTLRSARAEDSWEMQRMASDMEQLRFELKERHQQLQQLSMEVQQLQAELVQREEEHQQLQKEQQERHNMQSKTLEDKVKAEKEKQRTASQMALVGRTVSVAPPAPPSLVSLSDKEVLDEAKRRRLVPAQDDDRHHYGGKGTHGSESVSVHLYKQHGPVSRSSSKTTPGSRPSVPRARVHGLWEKAVQYGWRLLRVGHLESHERPVAVAMEEMCQQFQSYFHKKVIGIHEFMAIHSREQEFKAGVSDLLGAYSAGTLQAGVASIDLKKLEDMMLGDYNKGFNNAGGQAVAEKFFPEVNAVLRKLRRKRGTDRFKQDVGFEILGLDQLYVTVDQTNAKLMHEVKRLAKQTSGHAICPSLKGRSRARAKMLTKYGNDPACLTDIMRASITYPRVSDLYMALISIVQEDLSEQRRDFFILEVNDRFQNSKDGYRDISMLVNVDGVIGEVQLHVQSVLNAKKSKGHDIYKKQRLINESLFEACVRNNETLICALSRRHRICAANVRDKYGRSALHYCCQVGLVKATVLLLQFKADPWVMDTNGMMACELAIKGAHWDATRAVLAKMQQAKEDRSAQLRRLATDTVPWLCDHIARKPPSESKHTEQLLSAGRDLICLIQQHGADQPLQDWLLDAAVAGDMLRIRTLLELDFDFRPAPGQSSALDLAIENCHEELAILLSSYPPSVRRPGGFVCARCCRHTLEVHLKLAAQSEDAACAKVALTSRADPNRTTAFAPGKRSPLMAFAASGNLEMCQRLVQHRAQVDWIDQFGCGAMHYALALGHSHVVAYLEGIKSLPPLGIKDDKVVDTLYLTDGITQGCAAAVWRYLRKLEGSARNVAADASIVISRVIANHDQTALHLAVHAAVKGVDPSGQVCRALLAAKANTGSKRAKGDTALHIAAAGGHKSLYALIKRAAAEAEDIKAQHGLQVYQVQIEMLKNEAGQTPPDLLERSLKRNALIQQSDRMEEAVLLLRVGFFAFQHQALSNRLFSRLQVWRYDTAATWQEIILQRKGNLKELAKEKEAKEETSGPLTEDNSPLDRFETESTFIGTWSSGDDFSPREQPTRTRMSSSRHRSSVFVTARRDLHSSATSSPNSWLTRLRPQPVVAKQSSGTPSSGGRSN